MGAGKVYLQCFWEWGERFNPQCFWERVKVQPTMFLGAGKGSTRDKLLIK
jgi:hypothetical protein